MRQKDAIVVIGLGNPDCGDDGAGPVVAAAVSARLPDIRVLVRRGDVLALMEDRADSEVAILIDAAATRSGAGRIHRIDLSEDALPRDLSLSSTHAFGMADALGLAAALGRLPRHVIVYAIEGAAFAPGDTMSEAVTAAAGEAAERIVAELAPLIETGDRVRA